MSLPILNLDKSKMELIKIIYEKPVYGFGKPEAAKEYQGAKFDNGKIAYVNQDGDICVSDNAKKLKEVLLGAKIEVL